MSQHPTCWWVAVLLALCGGLAACKVTRPDVPAALVGPEAVGLPEDPDPYDTEADRAVAKALEKIITVDAQDMKVRDVLGHIADAGGVKLAVDYRELDKGGYAADALINMPGGHFSVRAALGEALWRWRAGRSESRPYLEWEIEGGRVEIGLDRVSRYGVRVVHLYDVRYYLLASEPFESEMGIVFAAGLGFVGAGAPTTQPAANQPEGTCLPGWAETKTRAERIQAHLRQ